MNIKNISFIMISSAIILTPISKISYLNKNDSNISVIEYDERNVVDEIKVDFKTLNKYKISSKEDGFIRIDMLNLFINEYDVDFSKGHYFIKGINAKVQVDKTIPGYIHIDHSHDKLNQSGYGIDHSGDVTINVPQKIIKTNYDTNEMDLTQDETSFTLSPSKPSKNHIDNFEFIEGKIYFVVTKFTPDVEFEDEWHIENWDGENDTDDQLRNWEHTLNLSEKGKREVQKITFSDGAEFNPYRHIKFDVNGNNYHNPAFYNSEGQTSAWADNFLFGDATQINYWNELSSLQKEDLKIKVDGEKRVLYGEDSRMITQSVWYNEYDEHDDRKGHGSSNRGGFWSAGSSDLKILASLDLNSNVKFETSNVSSMNFADKNIIYKMQIPNFKYSGVLNDMYDFSNDKFDFPKTTERLLKEKDIFTRENTTYLQLENLIRKDVVSEFNVPTGDETDIIFYKNVMEDGREVTRQVTDETKGLETGRLFIKFKATGSNSHVIGETDLFELNLPYADRIIVNQKYDKSINGNKSNYVIKKNEEGKYDVEVNTDTVFTIYSNEMSIQNEKDFIETGVEDGINYFKLNIFGSELFTENENRGKIEGNILPIKLSDAQLESNKVNFIINNLTFNNKPIVLSLGKYKDIFKNYFNEKEIIHKFGINMSANNKDYKDGSILFVPDAAEVDFDKIYKSSLFVKNVVENEDENGIIKLTIFGENEEILESFYIVKETARKNLYFEDYLETTEGKKQIQAAKERMAIPENVDGADFYEKNTDSRSIQYDYMERFLPMVNIGEIDQSNFVDLLELKAKEDFQGEIADKETRFLDIKDKLIEMTRSLLPKENFEITLLNDLYEYITFGTFANIQIKHLPTIDAKYYGETEVNIELYPLFIDDDNEL